MENIGNNQMNDKKGNLDRRMMHFSGPSFGCGDNMGSFRRLDARDHPSLYLSFAFPAIPHVDLSTREIDVGGRRVVTRAGVYAKALYYGRLQRLPAKWVGTRECRNNTSQIVANDKMRHKFSETTRAQTCIIL